MGGAVSTGIDNNDLIDNLKQADYIQTVEVERAFRAVDRGDYILPEYWNNAYRDQAWRFHHLHLSAPCIYSEVMEGLCLKPGLSFLNLGSGTGYLSTMVGLLLGHTGINHGVEYYDDVIVYANKKLEDFKKHSGAIDEFDFCEPKFMQGNCLCLSNERLYDRVYVGAACPEPYDAHIKSLLKIGGILVMPFNEQLLQIRRTAETTWQACTLLPVSFATLIVPKDGNKDVLELFSNEPKSLQSICRAVVRNILRANVDIEMPELKDRKHTTKSKQQKRKAAAAATANRGSMDGTHRQSKLNNSAQLDRRPSTDEFDDEGDDEIIDFVLNNLVRRGNVRFNRATAKNKRASSSDETTTDEEPEEDEHPDEPEDSSKNNHSESHTNSGPPAPNNDRSDDDSDSDSNHPRRRRRVDSHTYTMGSTSSNSSDDCPESKYNQTVRKTVDSPYTIHMRNKIKELPLPNILKDFLNFYRV